MKTITVDNRDVSGYIIIKTKMKITIAQPGKENLWLLAVGIAKNANN